MVLTARGPEQQSKGTDTVRAWINLTLALGLAGPADSGYGCLTGQGNGQGGREHGQKADQLPGYRKIDDPAARAHVAAVWGVDPDDAARAGRAAPTSCSTRSAPTVAQALLVFGSNPVVSAPRRRAHRRAARRARPPGRLRRRPVRDRRAGGRGPAGHPVGRGDGHDDQPGGPGAAAPARARAAADGVRSDLEILARAGRAARARRGLPDRPARRSSTSCAGPRAGGPADYAGHHLRADRRARTACSGPAPTPEHPGTPRLFADALRHPGRPGPVRRRSSTGRRPRSRDAEYPLLPHHRPGARAVPVRRADPPGRRAATPPPAPSSSCTRGWPSGSGLADGRPGHGDQPGAAT